MRGTRIGLAVANMILIAVLAGGAVKLSAAPPIYCLSHVAKAKRVCALKDYGYTVERISPPLTGVSFEELAPRLSNPNELVLAGSYRETDVKRFPLRQSELTIDHCQISSVSTMIRRDGTWNMNFHATQNPELVSRQERPKFVRFTQNRLYVTLRVYAGYRIANDAEPASLSRPAVAQIRTAAFWLRCGETSNQFVEGTDLRLGRQFDQIDRVEVDLQYE